MAGQPGDDDLIAGINVTPLVDIILVLLVVFIVTARILVTPAVPMDLPRASQSEEVQSVFAVALTETGPTRANGQIVADDAALARLARAALAKDAELRAVIDADGGARHRQIIHVLDVLKRAGVKRVAFGALPEEGTSP